MSKTLKKLFIFTAVCVLLSVLTKVKLMTEYDSFVLKGEYQTRAVPFVFIKTHKTGGSTIKAIADKYIKRKGLTTVETYPCSKFGGYPGKMKKEFMLLDAESDNFQKIGAINNHLRFDRKVLEQFMESGTKYISIMRRPWSQFQSSFWYFYSRNNLLNKLTLADTNCKSSPYYHIAGGGSIDFKEYFHRIRHNINTSIPWWFRSKNWQAYDLGIDALLDDDNAIRDAVEKISSEVDLVLITEYMDESIILLKDTLNLENEDILFERTNVNEPYPKIELVGEDLNDFNKMFKLDIALYNYFNETFWKKVEAFGRIRMQKNIVELHSLKRKSKYMKTNDDAHINRLSNTLREVKRKTKGLNRNKMFETLLKIKTKGIRRKLPNKTIEDLATYITENGGDCYTFYNI